MMKGKRAHAGFPEAAFLKVKYHIIINLQYAKMLVERGFRVARVEQVEVFHFSAK
jgi:hypothetical protein